MTKVLMVIGCAALVAACDGAVRMSPLSPTPVVAVATTPPSPDDLFREPYTQLIVGSTFQRTVDQSANPDCGGDPGFRCQYFRVTPERDGMLDIELSWVAESQPGQGLDLTHESVTDQIWAEGYGPGPNVYLKSAVKAGEVSQITVWYTLPGLEFTLRTTLRPN